MKCRTQAVPSRGLSAARGGPGRKFGFSGSSSSAITASGDDDDDDSCDHQHRQPNSTTLVVINNRQGLLMITFVVPSACVVLLRSVALSEWFAQIDLVIWMLSQLCLFRCGLGGRCRRGDRPRLRSSRTRSRTSRGAIAELGLCATRVSDTPVSPRSSVSTT
jgi:hypothetical protein